MTAPIAKPSETTRGRPRDESIDAAVVKALFEIIEEVGLSATTIDGVAERAGVGKATIYRRWESKEKLVIDAVAGLITSVEIPDRAEIREVLVGMLRAMRAFMAHAPAGTIFPWLVGEIAAGSELGRRYAESVILPRRQQLYELIDRYVRSGELRDDLDAGVAVDLLTGPVIMLKILGGFRDDPGDEWVESIVDTLLTGWKVNRLSTVR
jgi:AcrR family transcriptional regulator